jgi:hypothetical protein
MLCPRCNVNELAEEQALNALSRTTRGEHDVSVYVCSPCGSCEGLNEYFHGKTEPQSEWPVAEVRSLVFPEGAVVPEGLVF